MAISSAREELTNGFHLVVDGLLANSVTTMYGVVGIPVTDLARIAQARGIRFIGFRHEQPAGHAAAAAGFLTQRPGICLTVSAPGFLNGLVALANATTNCFPMIQISGSSTRATVDLEQGEYEELDQLAVAKTFAKAAYRVDRPEDIGLGIARAIRAALSGRPGGVYLDLPGAVLGATLPAELGASTIFPVVDPAPKLRPADNAIERALALLERSQRPLVILGKGAAYARADSDIREFIEATGIPFLPMSMAKGLLPDTHPQSAAAARSLALSRADVVMLVGARLNWLLAHGEPPRWGKETRFIQLDIEAMEPDSNRPIAAPVIGDIASSMAALVAALRPGRIQAPAEWLEALSAKKEENQARMQRHLERDAVPMDFYGALRAIRDVLTDRSSTFIVNEGANTLDFARDILEMRQPRKRLDSGTWGVMGVGLGYAIAAAIEGRGPVVAIEGDSAFGFSGMELETICRYRLPIIVVLFNNGGVYRGDDISARPGDPAPTALDKNARYDRLIEAFGGTGYYAETPAQVREALGRALAAGRPALINCTIDPKAGTESGHIGNLNPKSST